MTIAIQNLDEGRFQPQRRPGLSCGTDLSSLSYLADGSPCFSNAPRMVRKKVRKRSDLPPSPSLSVIHAIAGNLHQYGIPPPLSELLDQYVGASMETLITYAE